MSKELEKLRAERDLAIKLLRDITGWAIGASTKQFGDIANARDFLKHLCKECDEGWIYTGTGGFKCPKCNPEKDMYVR